MFRIAAIGAVCAILLCACNQSSYGPPSYAPGPPPPMAQEKPGEPQQSFSYTHFFALEMARDYVKPRFERAVGRCFHDASLDCELISSSMSAGDPDEGTTTQGQLVVALPHEKVEPFEKSLLDAVAGEGTDDVIMRSRSTQAENVTQQVTDLDHKIAQLTDYRDRLQALAKRPDLHADDLIKIEQELSDVESQLDDTIAQKNDVSAHVRRETLTVTLGERHTLSDAWRPLAQAWRDSLDTLSESAAAALQFVIQVLPWLPIVAGMIWLLSLIPRLIPKRKAAPPPKS